jgi:hypothetical protein
LSRWSTRLRELAAARVTDAPQAGPADAGQWHTRQIERLNARGLAVRSTPTNRPRRLTRRVVPTEVVGIHRAVVRSGERSVTDTVRRERIEVEGA